MKFKTNIELCEMSEDAVAGRTKITMTALAISENEDDHNENGITWIEDYVLDNLDSIVGASYKVCFVDDDKEIPSGHGTMLYDDDGNVIFPDSDTVGSIQEAYIEEHEIDGQKRKLLVTKGYLYKQSYPAFVEWLKSAKEDGDVFGSIEINGKANSKKIVYANGTGKNDDGTPQIGRQPKVFDFVSLAILSDIVDPADRGSRVIEINNKIVGGEKKLGRKKVNVSGSVEINELSYDDLSILITRAFNAIVNINSDDCCYSNYYYIHKLYPQSQRVIFCNWSTTPNEYMMANYSIQDNKVSLSNVLSVEQDWKPVNNEQEAEINTEFIKSVIDKSIENTKGEIKRDMDFEKTIAELNQKIENKDKEITEANVKHTELSEAVVNANKSMEELNAKVESLTEELNACKAELESYKEKEEMAEANSKKEAVQAYFDTEIPKNGFSDEEINSLKHFVEDVDLDGLKSAESEICTKKFKELAIKGKQEDSEVNSKVSSFISIKEKEKKVIADKDASVSFFNV